MKKSVLLVVGTFVTTVFGAAFAGPAQAQNYPWCALYGPGATQNCGFTTYQQCQETVSGLGGFCMQNNSYQAPSGSRSAPARRR